MNREDYCTVQELFSGDRRFRSLRVAIDASIRLTEIFSEMHRRGRHIQAFRPTDLDVLPDTGQVTARFGDLAGADPEGKDRDAWDIVHTPPEVIAGGRVPDQFSDRFLLAVLIFRFLTGGVHPLTGRRSVRPVMTREMKVRLFGTDPLFIFDPENGENGPDPKLHGEAEALWAVLPEWMKTCFLRVFARAGLEVPESRPSETEWRESLIRFQNRMIPCECGNILIDGGENAMICSRCGKEIRIGFRIEMKGNQIPAVRGNRIYRHRDGAGERWDPNPAARVVNAQNDPNRLGIQNVSGETWQALTTKGKPRDVRSDEVIPLKDGIMCQYGDDFIKITDVSSVGEK